MNGMISDTIPVCLDTRWEESLELSFQLQDGFGRPSFIFMQIHILLQFC